MKIKISNHGMERLAERCNFSKKEAYKVTQKAWDCGMKPSQYRSSARESFVSAKERHDCLEGHESTYRVYKGVRYVFDSDGTLITAYKDGRKPKQSKGCSRPYAANCRAVKEYVNKLTGEYCA